MRSQRINFKPKNFNQTSASFCAAARAFFSGAAFVLCLLFFSVAANAATFTVTNTNDSGAGSLRQAILNANAQPTVAHTINFSIGTGLKTINLVSPLPTISLTQLTIDGTTQGGFANVPLIELNGAGAGTDSNANGFKITGGNVTIKSLIINRFKYYGILASGSSVALNVYGSYIGTDANGSIDLGNGQSGIYLRPGDDNIVSNIGGAGANQRNVISGNDQNGVWIEGYYASEVRVVNNYIGTNATAVIDLGNSKNGIQLSDFSSGVTNAIVGGSLPEQRNVISGNDENGIFVSVVDSLAVQGNYIGLGANGLTAIGNSQNGIDFSAQDHAGQSVVIGGAGNAGNTISANGANGIKLYYSDFLGIGSIAPLIVGNRIGTDLNGTADRGNALNGILVSGLSVPQIGRQTAGEGNTISGNGGSGIYFSGGSGSVLNNRIGVSSLGAPLGNTGSGIYLGYSNGVNIGKENVVNSGNIISSNAMHGIRIAAFAENFKIVNNLIGTNQLNQNVGNGDSGIFVGDAVVGQIGGAAANNANTIAFNADDGITIKTDTNSADPSPSHLALFVNSIYSNGNLGIDLEDDGITINDAGDADNGANRLQNYPIIQGASPAQINGTLNSAANKAFRLDFYRVDSCDAGGHGEGRYHVGTTEVTTDASGNAYFVANNVALSTGQTLTATATYRQTESLITDTSEFSPCQTVSQPPGNLSLSAATYAVNENAGTAIVTVNRTNGSVGAINVAYATANGTATAGADYTATSGVLTFQTGETSKTFAIPITDDNNDEPAETINIALSNPTGGAAIVNPLTAVLTVSDNDAVPTVSASNPATLEGNEGAKTFVFDVTLSAASGFPVSVNYQTVNGTANAGVDYQTASGAINFAVGETAKSISVAVNGDSLVELDETFALNLLNPTNATVGSAGTATIQDDDNPGKLQFSLANYQIAENAGAATITVTRANGAAGAVSVDYATNNGTATAGADYAAVSGTLVLNDGQQSKTFTIPILNDNAGEANEIVLLQLANPLGGASLGALATAVLTISDDDGGLPQNVAISGKVTKNGAPLANVLLTLAGSQSATALTDANGNYNFANLQSGGNYLVTPTANNNVFEPNSLSFANLAQNQSNADFVASSGAPNRVVRVAAAVDAVPGNAVVVPIELVAQGNENSVGFSLNYDANLLSNAQISLGADAGAASLVVNDSIAGKIGALVSLPAGQTFAAGTRKIINVAFLTAQTNLFSTPLTFGNQPIGKEIADQNADVLPAAWQDGVVMFAQGFEADVAPRPTGSGNGTVTVADFAQIGKFIAGLDQMNPNYNEFQRADAAPKGTKGNGILSVSDYTQAGRYAAGLDAVQTSGGASAVTLFDFTPDGKLTDASLDSIFGAVLRGKIENADAKTSAPRVVRAIGGQVAPGQQITVSIEIDASGNENGFGFTLNYNPAKLAAPLVALGTGAQGATMFVNTLQNGKVGAVLALPAGQTLQAGTKQLVTVRFNVLPNAGGGQTPLAFADAPVIREVVDQNAEPLPVTFNDGSINIFAPTAANVAVGGKVADAAGRGIARARVTMTDQTGATRATTTNLFGFYRFAEVAAGETYVFAVASKIHSFSPQVRTINDDADDVDFAAPK